MTNELMYKESFAKENRISFFPSQPVKVRKLNQEKHWLITRLTVTDRIAEIYRPEYVLKGFVLF